MDNNNGLQILELTEDLKLYQYKENYSWAILNILTFQRAHLIVLQVETCAVFFTDGIYITTNAGYFITLIRHVLEEQSCISVVKIELPFQYHLRQQISGILADLYVFSIQIVLQSLLNNKR